MKSFIVFAAVVALAGVAAAQDAAQITQDGTKITVPLSNPAQPATVKLSMVRGSITITGSASQQQVIVESSGGSGLTRGRRNRETTPPPGMHRIDMGDNSEVVEDHNVVTIKPGLGGREHIDIQVPATTNLEIKAVDCGGIDVTGVTGDIDVECTNGSLDLRNVSGSVVAHTLNGSINVVMDKVAEDKAMSFTSLNGKVEVTLPADTKARLRIKTNNGAVFTDFDVEMEKDSSKPVVEDGRGQGGKYRIRMDRGVYGTINGGGPEYLFQTMNGEILIHKK
ncbi:MAG TPA: DUF4097 family beta strand repeat-containing protein [Bryobacteraceae bacterium]|nr:DUF4097 family beta strand repeat-containing protein [Bryobacteraceae bacterium]